MTDWLRIRTHWMARQETAAACAARLLPMLQQLSELNPAFRRWFESVESEHAPRIPAWPMPPRLDDLTATIQQGQAMKDVPHEPWPELGYFFHAWNDQVDPTCVWLDGHVGAYSKVRKLPNSVTLKLSPPMPGNEDFTDFGTVSGALLATARHWDVLWGAIIPTDYNPPGFRVEGRLSWPLGGWITYLSAPLANGITPPPTVMAERLSDGAMLLIATEETFDPRNPAHVAAADAIDAALAPIRQAF